MKRNLAELQEDEALRQKNEKETNGMDDQHVYHHSDSDGARVYVKVERNTKGFNYEASVTGAKTVDEAMAMLQDAEAKLRAVYGPQA